jgi:magnesium transporter
MSKIDPNKLNKLDRRATLLLQAAQTRVGNVDEKGGLPLEEQEPGIDALRGTFGTVGSIIRARTRRMSQNSQNSTHARLRPPGAAAPYDSSTTVLNIFPNAGVTRHQLYDPPVPRDDDSSNRDSVLSQPFSTKRPPTIKFDSQDVVHSYKRPGSGDDVSTHEHRQTRGSTLHDVYPPLSTLVGNDREPNLLSASPTMLRQSTFPQIIPKIPPPHESQMLHIPPSIANEHTVQSAPAAIRQTRSEDPPMPTTSKGGLLFDSTSGKGTLMSFPSVTDSAPSEWGVDVDKDGKVVRKGKSRELPTAPKIPLKSPKKYPRGSADDDDEESETLFRDDTISSEGHYDSNASTSPPDVTGIRLVMINEREYF